MIRRAILLLLIGVGLGSCSGPAGDDVRATATADQIAAGEALFTANCAGCHGSQAVGTDQGPPLVHAYYRPGHHSDTAFHLAVRNGVQPHHWNFGTMPPLTNISDQEVDEIVAYVRSLQQIAGIN